MDRRMYRGNYYRPDNRNTSNRRPDGVCGDQRGTCSPEKRCDGRLDDKESGFSRYPLAMCYVPWQRFENLYENEFKAWDRGTLFKDLDLEFLGRSCRQDGCKK